MQKLSIRFLNLSAGSIDIRNAPSLITFIPTGTWQCLKSMQIPETVRNISVLCVMTWWSCEMWISSYDTFESWPEAILRQIYLSAAPQVHVTPSPVVERMPSSYIIVWKPTKEFSLTMLRRCIILSTSATTTPRWLPAYFWRFSASRHLLKFGIVYRTASARFIFTYSSGPCQWRADFHLVSCMHWVSAIRSLWAHRQWANDQWRMVYAWSIESKSARPLLGRSREKVSPTPR